VLRRSVVQARKGDTSASLSQRYGVSAANLAEWNPGLAAGGLRKGQSVVLFLPSRSAAPRAQARTPAPAAGARTPARTSTTKGAPRTSSPSTKAAAKPAAKAKR
jgi:membrane-bound lytic murein transglycosylase D